MTSISFALINIVWFGTLLTCWYFNIYFGMAAFLWIFACPVLTFLGILTGAIEFYKNRLLLGLLLNLPPLLVTLPILYYFLSPSDGLPPQH